MVVFVEFNITETLLFYLLYTARWGQEKKNFCSDNENVIRSWFHHKKI